MNEDELVGLRIGEVDLSHSRLVELFRLADAAKPFYDWIEKQALSAYPSFASLDSFLASASKDQLVSFIRGAQEAVTAPSVPSLYDGAVRPYRPSKALYLMLAWLIRDAPQQRLAPLISQLKRNGMSNNEAEAESLARLILAYRGNVETFQWQAVREVVADRLEGSRRSLRGRLAEAAVRAVIAEALADEVRDGKWGRFDRVTLENTEVNIGGHSFDVCVDCEVDGELRARMVLPVKSRETQGGGHANLFTRDIETAMSALQDHEASTGVEVWLVPVIIAENWHSEQVAHIREISDEVVFVESNPNTVESIPDVAAAVLRRAVSRLLTGDKA
jgi:hypothetical protein